jgi:TonB family protein
MKKSVRAMFASLALAICFFSLSSNARAQTYLDPSEHNSNSAAVDINGKRHLATEYRGKVPWLNDIVNSVSPLYPEWERARRHEGRGVIRLLLDTRSGYVRQATVLKSTGYVELDDAAVWAFRIGYGKKENGGK